MEVEGLDHTLSPTSPSLERGPMVPTVFSFRPGDVIRRPNGLTLWVITETGTDSSGAQWIRKVRLGKPAKSASLLITYATGWALEARPSQLLADARAELKRRSA